MVVKLSVSVKQTYKSLAPGEFDTEITVASVVCTTLNEEKN